MASTDSNELNISESKLKPNESGFGDSGNLFSDSRLTSSMFDANGYGMLDSAITSTMKGIDLFNNPSPAPQTHEQFGLVFFTRPMLNLSYHNTSSDPVLSPLLTKEKSSIGAYVRAMLDPLNHLSNSSFDTPLVDKENAFMPLLSNTLETLSGWQDPMVDTWTSASGVVKQAYTLIDSTNDVFMPVDLSATFRNIRGNVLGYMFHVWQRYCALSIADKIHPHPAFIESNSMDYGTRIYSLVLDQTRTFVQEISCTGVSFPLTSPAGGRSNYNRSEVINREVDTINQTFRSMGLFYYNPSYMYDFNTTTGLLRPNFNDESLRKKYYRVLWPKEYKLFAYRAFPRINPRSARLEWWISRSEYRKVMGTESYAGMETD